MTPAQCDDGNKTVCFEPGFDFDPVVILILILNILLNKKSKRIEPEAVVLIEGSFLTKYTNSHAHQYTIQHNMHSNFGSCDLPTNVH